MLLLLLLLLHETKKCCELMRSVIRGKILEGRCGFGTEEQRTSGKKEYVVDGQLRALCIYNCFSEGKYRNDVFSHLRIFHISIQVLNQTWTKKKGFLACRLQLRETLREELTNRN